MSFPVYLLTMKSEMQVSRLELGQFTNKPAWIEVSGDGSPAIVMFTTKPAITRFCKAQDISLQECLPIEFGAQDFADELERLSKEMSHLTIDPVTPPYKYVAIAAVLARLRS
jgi:hypothetical protein